MSKCRLPAQTAPKPTHSAIQRSSRNGVVISASRALLRAIQYGAAMLSNADSARPALPSAHDLLKARWMASYVPNGAEVLDIGCGNGSRLSELGLFVNDLQAVGVDLAMKAPSGILLPGLNAPTLSVFDGTSLPFADKSFDVSMICYVLHHLSEPHAQELLSEAVRVTRGRVLLLEDSRPEFSALYRVRNWAHATEANLEYEGESTSFRRNFRHTMFKTHDEWCSFLSSFEYVRNVACVPLEAISHYQHHTMFVAEIAADT